MYDEAMNARLSPKQPDLTRQKLLESAFSEIHRHGFQAASITRILADTGLSKGALYHHFPDKKALGIAVIEEMVRPLLSAMMFEPLRNTPQPLTALREVVRKKARTTEACEVELGCPLNNLMQEMSPLDEDFRRHLGGLFDDWVAAISDALRRGKLAGEVDGNVNIKESALFIASALEGCVGMSKNLQSVKTFKSCLAQLAGFIESLRNIPA
jgi:TetR/AcrR family transcriptional repressor of nem operon